MPIKEHIAVLKSVRIYTQSLAIISSSDTVIGETSVWYGEGRFHPVFDTLRLPAIYHLKGKGLYLPGDAHSSYFHFMTDTLPDLCLLEMAGMKLEDFDYVLMTAPKKQYEYDLIEFFGIPSSKIVGLYEHAHFEAEDLTLPTVHNRQGAWFVDYMRQKLLVGVTDVTLPATKRRLYITRRKAPTRRITNEEEVFSLLETYGFEFVECDGLSVQEQVAMFRSAEIVAGPHGAGLTNVMFSSPGTKLLELRARQENGALASCFQRLCSFAGVEHYLIFGEGVGDASTTEGHDMDILINLDVLREELDLLSARFNCL